MRKLVVFITLALISVVALPQKYMTKNGFISFYSHTPLEEIRADNNQVAGIIDVATNEMVFQVLMKSFHFDRALMEEHFNENYIESDKFPKASFKGSITGPAGTDLKKEGTYEVTVSGDMTIHGVTKPLTTQGTIMVTADAMKGSSKFTLTPEDYDISIPGVVREKIASQVEVTVEMNYAPMDR
jgi:polyisoprenoid-binding protein YceI